MKVSLAILTLGCVATIAFLFKTGLQLRDATRTVSDQQRDLADTKAEVASLTHEADQLRVQLREVEMLYDAEKAATYAASHFVSTDGRLEMVTWRDGATNQLCAHWCARQDPGGPCLPSGPDRCIP